MTSEAKITPDPRIEQIVDLIVQLASGNLSARGRLAKLGDEWDAILGGLNMLAEELEASITSRERMEEALQENNQWLAATLKSIGDAVITIDNEGMVTFMNPAAEALTGWKQDEAIGKNIGFEVIGGKTFASIEDSVKKALQDDILINVTHQPILIARNGTEIPIEYSGAPIKDDKGNIAGIVMVIKDITERKRAEEKLRQTNEELVTINTELKNTQAQLVQSAKLASIGELATGVAHELNQPLTYIRSSAQLGIMKLSDNPDPQNIRKILKRVEEGTDRMMKIITQLRNFARRTDVDLTPLKLHDILKNSLILVKEQFKLHNIRLEKRFAPDLPPVLGSSQQLEQVFINLLSNARDALEGREEPTLTIQTEFCSQEDGSGQVVVRFSDNGRGISEAHLEKIFDPFFTTKEEGKGTGLGLSISYRIIQQHRGQIHVSSIESKGTTFTIVLPVMEESKTTVRS